MPFERGSLSFRMCALPEPLPEDAVERFAAKAAGPLEHVRDEPRWGWVSGRHLLETRIDEETAMVAGYLHLALRQAERKVPTALLRAHCRMAELARMAETQSDQISRKERKAIKEAMQEELLPKMPPQISGIPFVADVSDDVVYVGATSNTQLDMFLEHFCQAIGYEPIPQTPDVLCHDVCKVDADTVPPLNFSPALPDASAAGTLGQNFLTWLWFYQEERGGVLPQTQLGEFAFQVDGPLVFVADDTGALESTIRKGMPTISAEAKAALMVGKKLKRAKVTFSRGKGEDWTFTIDADEFVIRSLKLPEGEALDPASIFEERMTNLYVFRKLFTALFQRYISEFKQAENVKEFQKQAQTWVEKMEGR